MKDKNETINYDNNIIDYTNKTIDLSKINKSDKKTQKNVFYLLLAECQKYILNWEWSNSNIFEAMRTIATNAEDSQLLLNIIDKTELEIKTINQSEDGILKSFQKMKSEIDDYIKNPSDDEKIQIKKIDTFMVMKKAWLLLEEDKTNTTQKYFNDIEPMLITIPWILIDGNFENYEKNRLLLQLKSNCEKHLENKEPLLRNNATKQIEMMKQLHNILDTNNEIMDLAEIKECETKLKNKGD